MRLGRYDVGHWTRLDFREGCSRRDEGSSVTQRNRREYGDRRQRLARFRALIGDRTSTEVERATGLSRSAVSRFRRDLRPVTDKALEAVEAAYDG